MNQLGTIESKLDRILELLEKKKVVRKVKVNMESAEFERWWGLYPKKIAKKKCLALWLNNNIEGSVIACLVIDDTRMRLELDQQWIDGYAPNPQTYLNGERWNDDITPIVQKKETVPRNDDAAVKWGEKRGITAKVGEPMWQFRQRLEAVL